MKSIKKQLGIRLFNLAIVWSHDMPEPQCVRDDVIKSMRGRKSVINGSKSIKAAREAVESASKELSARHSIRHDKHAAEKLGIEFGGLHNPTKDLPNKPNSLTKCYWPFKTLTAKIEHQYKTVTIANKLRSIRLRAIEKAYDDTLKNPTHGDVCFVLSSIPCAVDVTVEHSLDWNLYRGSFKGRPANVYQIEVTVPNQWRTRVQKQGIATADGMLTLDAAPLDGAPQGMRLYAATWAQQGRGYEINVHHGVIATDGERFHHADSIKKALAGLRRKVAYVPPTHEQSVERFCKRYESADFMVCLDDAREIGACEYGIRSWCDANGIDMARRCIPVSEAVKAYRNRPQPEARSAILYARKRVTA